MIKKLLLKITAIIFCFALSITVSACTETVYTVTFISNGEVYFVVENANESSSMPSENPTKINCDFGGWFVDDGVFNESFSFSNLKNYKSENGNITVYAKFNNDHTHAFNTTVIAPTCVDDGYTKYSCLCGYNYTADTTSKLNHDFKNYLANNDATYENDGTKTATCEREGCGETDTVTDDGTKLIASLTFKNLTVDNYTVLGKVSSTVSSYDLDEEITVSAGAEYHVYTNENLTEETEKTVALEEGDNEFFIAVKWQDKTYCTYNIVIRRLPIYSVTFNTNTTTDIAEQFIEEGGLISTPNELNKAGYTFSGWSYDFSTPVTTNLTINAVWIANKNTPYKVEYYFENINDNGYTLNDLESQNLTGETDTVANYNIKNFNHFTYEYSSQENIIKGDGSLVIRNYFSRNKYLVTFNLNNGELVSGELNQQVKYGGNATAPTVKRKGYNFNGFDKTFNEISSAVTVNALWTNKTFTVNYNSNGANCEIESSTAVYDENFTAPTISRSGYHFGGWYYGNIKVESGIWNIDDENLSVNLTATWLQIFNLTNNEITSLTDYGKTLKSLSVPNEIDGVKISSIYKNAFANDTVVESVTISNNVTTIGESAFKSCVALKSVVLPENLSVIDNSLFYLCENLLTIDIPSNILQIKDLAFYGCKGLSIVEIPSLVESIGFGAFALCENVVEFKVSTLNANFTALNGNLYSKNLKTLIAYASKKAETTFTVNDGVSEISAYAFSSNNLTTVTISNSVLKIGDFAFFNGLNLTEVVLGDSVESIGENAFRNCKKLTEINIPNSVKTLGKETFYGCQLLTTVNIGSGLSGLGQNVFDGCSKLSNIVVSEDNKIYKSIDGSLYNYKLTAILQYAVGKTQTSFTLLDSVTVIRANAFQNAVNLTEVILTDNIIAITDNAFINCTSLQTITLPSSLEEIGVNAFYGCENLKTVINKSTLTIEKGSETNGYVAFYADTIL